MSQSVKSNQLIANIPESRYFSIGEVARLCELNSSVLRYWEAEFPMLKPCTRKGNRRYYQKADILLIEQIKTLLYQQGFTIEGARKYLAQKPSTASNNQLKATDIHKLISELQDLDLLLSGLQQD